METTEAIQTDESTPPTPGPRRFDWTKGFLKQLGPGLITGAADDDPSGIATYSQVGAKYGFQLLWVMPLTLPLMAAIQEISARIGRVTGKGIAANIRRCYSPWLLYPVIALLLIANTINIGADIGAMGDAVQMLVGGPTLLYTFLFAVACVAMQVFFSYERTAKYLKWLTLALFAYVITAFVVHTPWRQALRGTIIPHLKFSKEMLAALIAVLGTTISPYLLAFLAGIAGDGRDQGRCERRVVEERADAGAWNSSGGFGIDTYVGMTFSNLVAYFIILSAAATLFKNGGVDIETSRQAAEALKPVAGRLAATLFAAGIIGTGLLAIPVLAGSAAFAVAEAMRWTCGLDR